MIEIDDVSYSYENPSAKKNKRSPHKQQAGKADWGVDPHARWALRHVSLTVQDGEFFGIAGHTGSGKSTLIQHMNGLIQPHEGQVRVDGVDISSKEAAARARENVGVVFQYPENQLFAATVFDDVAFGPRNQGLSGDELEQRYGWAMGLVDLDAEALREASPFELSGGQQRRVAFAGVLAMNPRTLILDEPVAGLDPRSREDFLGLIERLHSEQGLTIVMVSHSMDDLARFCDRVALLNQGQLAVLGTPDEVFADGAALKSIGLGLPAAPHLAAQLRERGIDIPQSQHLYTLDSLSDAIAELYRAREGRRS